MRLSQPKKKVFWITVIAAIVAVVAYVLPMIIPAIPAFVPYIGVGLLAAAYILLVLSVTLKGI